MTEPSPKLLKKVESFKGCAFLLDVFSDGYKPVPQDILDTVDYLVAKGKLKFFYRFYMEDDPGKYVDFNSIDDVPYDQTVMYPPTEEDIFIPRYSEPNKFYYFASDEKYIEDKVEIHAER